MTFLTICQEVNNRLGIQNRITSVDADGYQDLVVEMVSDAWRDLQSYREDWAFLKTSKTHTIVAGTQQYNTYVATGSANILTSTESARFGHWDASNFLYVRDTLVGYTYDAWIRQNTSGAVDTPTKFAINDANNDVYFQNLSANKDVTVSWYKSPQILTSDNEEPECPQEHHQVVVWAGLKNAANYFGNSAVYQYAMIQYDKALGALYRSQIPSRRVQMRPFA